MPARARTDRPAQAGFTLIELVISMVLLALISLSIYGLATIGARSAGAGERRTEQARRIRIATSLITRQLRSAAPLYAVVESERESETLPYFLGEADRIDFITAQPQQPDNGGFALVSYWLEDGMFMMSEMPYFLAFSEERLGRDYDHLITSVPLMYDVARLDVSYQRFDAGEDEGWETSWDASFEDALPAVVRIEVEPSADDGPSWYHEVPVFVGVYNEMMGEDDFQRRRGRLPQQSNRTDEEDEPDDDPADGEGDGPSDGAGSGDDS